MASRNVIDRCAATLCPFCVGEKIKTFDVDTLAKLWFTDQMKDGRTWKRHARDATQDMLRDVTRTLRGQEIPVYTFAITNDSKLYQRRPIGEENVAILAIPGGRRKANAIRYSPADSGDVYPPAFRDHHDEVTSKQLNTRNGLPETGDPLFVAGAYLVTAAEKRGELEARKAPGLAG